MGRADPQGRARLARRVVTELGFALVTAGVVVLAFVAYDLWGTSLAARHDQALLARQFQAAVASAGQPGTRSDSPTVGGPTATTGPSKGSGSSRQGAGGRRVTAPAPAGQGASALAVPGPGVALARIFIPAIGVDRYVVQGVDEADLQMGPGHYPGTPMPGQPGNVGIAGHRTTFGAPFFELGHLVSGDMVYITGTSGWTWGYRVQRLFSVDPTDVAVLTPTSAPELTLTTCTPPFEATQRLVVRAELAGRAPPGTSVTSLPERLAQHQVLTQHPFLAQHPDLASTGYATPAPVHGEAGFTVPRGRKAPAVRTGSAGRTVAAVPLPQTGGAVAGAALWGAAALLVWVLARLVAALWVPRYKRAAGARRRRSLQAGTLVVGAALVCVPLWSCFANIVQLLPPNF